jgi:hypothetical protein
LATAKATDYPRNKAISSQMNCNRYITYREELEYFGQKLGVKKLEDWYDITADALKSIGGTTLVSQNGGYVRLLLKCYPGKTGAYIELIFWNRICMGCP